MTIRGILLDLSGVLYVGSQVVPGAVPALGRLRATGLPLRFVTNTTRSTRVAIGEKLRGLGFAIDDAEIFTAPAAARAYLAEHGLAPHLIIHPGLAPEFADLDTRAPDAVVLGDAGEAFDYAHLNAAFRLLMAGAPLIAMGDNRYFMEDDGLSLDIGPFVRALEYAAGVEAVVLGKPAAGFFLGAVAALGCDPGEVVMVGDDALADVEGALKAGLAAVLVQTGKYRAGDEVRIGEPGAGLATDFPAWVEQFLAGRG
ncbi:MAG TPA: TIGR01458 family HAD-type hydrolase [Thioalkalivibrio sp.]|nr:TIGR01458 family HAD-type hydrolase [Thioalkalivibrio sp.]